MDVLCGCKMLYLHVADLLDVFENMRRCEWWQYLIMSERVCNHVSAAYNLSKQRHLEFMSLTQFMPQHPGNTDSIKTKHLRKFKKNSKIRHVHDIPNLSGQIIMFHQPGFP